MECDIPMDVAVISVYYTTPRKMKRNTNNSLGREIVADRAGSVNRLCYNSPRRRIEPEKTDHDVH
jgi:hypothetical protein